MCAVKLVLHANVYWGPLSDCTNSHSKSIISFSFSRKELRVVVAVGLVWRRSPVPCLYLVLLNLMIFEHRFESYCEVDDKILWKPSHPAVDKLPILETIVGVLMAVRDQD